MARPVGSKNKIPQSAKENIQSVFVLLGGTAAMAKWARKNPTAFYKIYARLLPIDVDVSVKVCDVSSEPLSPDEWDKQYGADRLASPARPPTGAH